MPVIEVVVSRFQETNWNNGDNNALGDLISWLDKPADASDIVKVNKDLSIITRVNDTSADHPALLGRVSASVHDLHHIAVRNTKL
mgnify:CR=1 FL=1